MYRIILFLVLIALAAAGAAWVADQPGDVVMSWGGWHAHPSLPVFVLLLGIVIVAAMLAWTILLALWRTAGGNPAQPARTPSRARPPRHHARPARDRPRRFRLGAAPMPMSRAAMPRTIRWRCCCTRNRRNSTATARARERAFRAMAERAGHAAVGLARAVHRGAARRRSGRRGDDRGRGAEAGPGLDLGVAGGVGISLRQGRLGRGADDPR